MKKSRFTNEQVAFALKQAETGTPVEEACRIHVFDDLLAIGIMTVRRCRWSSGYWHLGREQ